MKQHRHRTRLAAFAIASACTSSLFADTVTTSWIGGDVAGSWSDATKWSNGVPNNVGTLTYDAVINSIGSGSGPIVMVTDRTSINSLRVSGGTVSLGILLSGTTFVDPDGSLSVGGGISGNGTISTNFSRLASTAGTLTIGLGITVNDSRSGNGLGSATQPLDNYGLIIANNATVSGGPIHNYGTIHGPAFLGGNFTLADLGNLESGTFTIAGTLQNEGQTLHLNSLSTRFRLGGTISGGTLDIASNTPLEVPWVGNAAKGAVSDSHLNNVVINGTIALLDTANLFIDDGLLRGNGKISLKEGSLDGPDRIAPGGNAAGLTIAAGMTVEGGGRFDGQLMGMRPLGRSSGIGYWTQSNGQTVPQPVTNYGFIHSLAPTTNMQFILPEFDIDGSAISNYSRIEIAPETLMYVTGGQPDLLHSGAALPTTLTMEPGSTLSITMSSTANRGLLDIIGSLDLSTVNDSLLLSANSAITPGTYYQIISTTGGITGAFDSVSPGFQIEYRNSNTELWAAVVPEPTAVFLLGAGAFTVFNAGSHRRGRAARFRGQTPKRTAHIADATR